MCSRPPNSPTIVGSAVATIVWSSDASSSTSISPPKTTPIRGFCAGTATAVTCRESYPASGGSGLHLAADRPLGLGQIDELDPDLVGGRAADLGDRGGHLLRDLLLLLRRTARVPLDGDDGHGYASAGSSSWTRRFLGRAPTIVCAASPFLKTMSVGIDMTP